jgi:hypothetical protein
MEPTDWFRIRHSEPFSEAAFRAFQASCSIYRARIEATLEHWTNLPTEQNVPKPTVEFFPPELSEDRRVMSLPVRVENKTLGSRALLQYSASAELYGYLPFPLAGQVEVGVTEPSFSAGGKWRNDWWNPNTDNTVSWDEAQKLLGMAPGSPRRWKRAITIRPKNAFVASLCWLLRKWGHEEPGRRTER